MNSLCLKEPTLQQSSQWFEALFFVSPKKPLIGRRWLSTDYVQSGHIIMHLFELVSMNKELAIMSLYLGFNRLNVQKGKKYLAILPSILNCIVG